MKLEGSEGDCGRLPLPSRGVEVMEAGEPGGTPPRGSPKNGSRGSIL